MPEPGSRSDVLGVVVGAGRARLGDAVGTVAAVLERPLVVLGVDDDEPVAADRFDVLRLPRDDESLRTMLRSFAWVVIHDPCCPAVTRQLVGELAGQPDRGVPVILVQPVLETLKLVHDRVVVATVDREKLRVVASPLAAPGPTLADVPDLAAAFADPGILVTALRALGPVELREGPPGVRRITEEESS